MWSDIMIVPSFFSYSLNKSVLVLYELWTKHRYGFTMYTLTCTHMLHTCSHCAYSSHTVHQMLSPRDILNESIHQRRRSTLRKPNPEGPALQQLSPSRQPLLESLSGDSSKSTQLLNNLDWRCVLPREGGLSYLSTWLW